MAKKIDTGNYNGNMPATALKWFNREKIDFENEEVARKIDELSEKYSEEYERTVLSPISDKLFERGMAPGTDKYHQAFIAINDPTVDFPDGLPDEDIALVKDYASKLYGYKARMVAKAQEDVEAELGPWKETHNMLGPVYNAGQMYESNPNGYFEYGEQKKYDSTYDRRHPGRRRYSVLPNRDNSAVMSINDRNSPGGERQGFSAGSYVTPEDNIARFQPIHHGGWHDSHSDEVSRIQSYYDNANNKLNGSQVDRSTVYLTPTKKYTAEEGRKYDATGSGHRYNLNHIRDVYRINKYLDYLMHSWGPGNDAIIQNALGKSKGDSVLTVVSFDPKTQAVTYDDAYAGADSQGDTFDEIRVKEPKIHHVIPWADFVHRYEFKDIADNLDPHKFFDSLLNYGDVEYNKDKLYSMAEDAYSQQGDKQLHNGRSKINDKFIRHMLTKVMYDKTHPQHRTLFDMLFKLYSAKKRNWQNVFNSLWYPVLEKYRKVHPEITDEDFDDMAGRLFVNYTMGQGLDNGDPQGISDIMVMLKPVYDEAIARWMDPGMAKALRFGEGHKPPAKPQPFLEVDWAKVLAKHHNYNNIGKPYGPPSDEYLKDTMEVLVGGRLPKKSITSVLKRRY